MFDARTLSVSEKSGTFEHHVEVLEAHPRNSDAFLGQS